MSELQAHLARIRSDAAECLLLSTVANGEKRDMFGKMAEHLNHLASEVEKTVAANGTSSANAMPASDAVGPKLPATYDQAGTASDQLSTDNEMASSSGSTRVRDRLMVRSRRVIQWLVAAAAVVLAGTFLLTSKHGEQTKAEAQSTSTDGAKADIAALVVGEPAERQAIAERLDDLIARTDRLEKALENFKSASAQIVDPSSKGKADARNNDAASHRRGRSLSERR